MRTTADFHKGDRVVLIAGADNPSPAMPLVGSTYEDIGTVTNADVLRGYIYVRWDHAYSTHAYYPSTLELHSIYTKARPEPNREFKRQKFDRLKEAKESEEMSVQGVMVDGKVTLSYSEWKKSQIDR